MSERPRKTFVVEHSGKGSFGERNIGVVHYSSDYTIVESSQKQDPRSLVHVKLTTAGDHNNNNIDVNFVAGKGVKVPRLQGDFRPVSTKDDGNGNIFCQQSILPANYCHEQRKKYIERDIKLKNAGDANVFEEDLNDTEMETQPDAEHSLATPSVTSDSNEVTRHRILANGSYNASNVEVKFVDKGATASRVGMPKHIADTTDDGTGNIFNQQSVLPVGYNEQQRAETIEQESFRNSLRNNRHESSGLEDSSSRYGATSGTSRIPRSRNPYSSRPNTPATRKK